MQIVPRLPLPFVTALDPPRLACKSEIDSIL